MTKVSKLHAKSNKTPKYKTKPDPIPLHQDFFYKPRRKAIDWRLLASINIDEITRDNNVTVLQKCIDNITFCDIHEHDEMQDQDPNLVKMFQLSQLIIEFLLHSQKFLLSDKDVVGRQMEEMALALEKATNQSDKTARALEEKQKEIKALKKALFAFEIMAKQPTKRSEPQVSTFHVSGKLIQRCRYCSKAFSTPGYLSSHELRRHGDILSDNDGDASVKHTSTKAQQSTELQKVTELIEKFTNHLSEKENEKLKVKDEHTRDLAEKLADRLAQEKLQFETELQSLKTTLYREIEEERQILREDRKAFENIVNTHSKVLTHVGDLEEDEESRNSRNHTLPRQESKIIEQKPENDSKKFLEMEAKLSVQIAKIREEMIKENDTKAMSLEKKLERASAEIARLKLELDSTHKDSPKEKVQNHTSVKVIDDTLEQHTQVDSKVTICIPAPEATPKLKYSAAPTLQTDNSKRDTWKKYVSILKQHNCTPNPHAKWASSKYLHPVGEMQSEKELLAIDIDQFLAERGITEVNIAKLSTDPTMKAITTQLSGYIEGQRQASSQIEFYDEMRAYLENQVESEAAAAFNLDNVNTNEEVQAQKIIRKANSPNLQSSPTRSSIRKASSSNALAKNVKLSEVAEERVIIPKSTKTQPAALSPLKGLNVSVTAEDLLPPTPAGSASPFSAGTPSYGVSSSPTMLSTVKNAFSMIAKTLTSPSRAKPNYGAQFDYVMRAGSPPNSKPILPPREPKKYLDIPRERIKSRSSTSQTSTSEEISSEESSSNTNTHEAVSSPPTSPVVKTQPINRSQSETSFAVSELSEAGDNRKLLDFDLHVGDMDAFDIITEEDENLPPVILKGVQSATAVNTSKKALEASDDEDVLEFLDEIDASLDDRPTGKVSEKMLIDDIDDFDN